MRKLVFLTLICLLTLGSLALAQTEFIPTHFIVGQVESSNPAVIAAAQGKTIRLYHEGNPEDYIEDTIGTLGKANQDNYFMFNAPEAPPLASWQPGDKMTIFIPAFEVDGTSYAGIATIETSTAGVDILEQSIEIVEASDILPDENPKIKLSTGGPINFSINQNSPNVASEAFNITNIGKLTLNPII